MKHIMYDSQVQLTFKVKAQWVVVSYAIPFAIIRQWEVNARCEFHTRLRVDQLTICQFREYIYRHFHNSQAQNVDSKGMILLHYTQNLQHLSWSTESKPCVSLVIFLYLAREQCSCCYSMQLHSEEVPWSANIIMPQMWVMYTLCNFQFCIAIAMQFEFTIHNLQERK